MRILYAGSPECSVKPLIDIVLNRTNQVAGVLTNPPAPVGRSKELISTPVAQAVFDLQKQGFDIPLLTPQKLDAAAREQIALLNPDILVCFAYGKIFGPKFMALFKNGGINVHPSLLPLFRGCAPIQAAILTRQKETGITIQRIAPQMDAGNILLQTKFELLQTDTTESVMNSVSEQAGSLLLTVLESLKNGTQTETVQNESRATYCTFLKKEDGKINWNNSAEQIDAQIRAFTPNPGCFTFVNNNVLFLRTAQTLLQTEQKSPVGTVVGTDSQKGILIQTGNGILAVSNLQWQAKKAMNWKDFINGSRNFIGSVCDEKNKF